MVIIDDGSDDGTSETARCLGVDRVLRFARRRRLARAFKAGIDAALQMGADIIVNMDGDNQYDGADIPLLVAPILSGQADIAVGDRRPGSLAHFSVLKRWMQRLGSSAMRWLSDTSVADSTSGFRAYSREAALQLNVVTEFTYTLETLIQAGVSRIQIADVPVRARPTPRASRLAPTMGHYLTQASIAIVRAYALYRPIKFSAISAWCSCSVAVLWEHATCTSGGKVRVRATFNRSFWRPFLPSSVSRHSAWACSPTCLQGRGSW